MKKVFIPEERITEFLNLLDTDDDPVTIQFHMSFRNGEDVVNRGYVIGIPDSLNEIWFLDSILQIPQTKEL